MLRSIGIIVLGFVVAVALITAIDYLNYKVFSWPPGVNFSDPATVRAAVPLLPLHALLMLLAAWFVGTFAGCWLAACFAARYHSLHGVVVGVALLFAGIADLAAIRYPPSWFWILGVSVYAAGALLGTTLGRSAAASHDNL